MAKISPALDHMLRVILAEISTTQGKVLLLGRTPKEMQVVMRAADTILDPAPYVARCMFEDDDVRSCFHIGSRINPDTGEAGELFISNVQYTQPEDMEFFGTWKHNDVVYWPNAAGVFAALSWEIWEDAWSPWEGEVIFGEEAQPPHYRPDHITSATTFDVGPAEPIVPETARISVWNRLRTR
jgi:hypothetical protein